MQNGLGVTLSGSGATFQVWAPIPDKVDLYLPGELDRIIPMEQKGEYWHVSVEGAQPGTRYLFKINNDKDFPDPASRSQPEGVHGPSEIIAPEFPWSDECWFGLPIDRYVIYEMHVGTFTEQGTFEGIIPHLSSLKELGITAIELMPVAQFPGSRNWGYDGVYPYAVQNSYGGAHGLKELVNAAHSVGMAVILDVVYNHLGPEGNYLGAYGPYFTDSYKTPWGDAINYDGEMSEAVREFFLNNAAFWIREFHVDALRLDACHLIFDATANHILEAFAKVVQDAGETSNRRTYTIAESDANDPRYIRSPEVGGYGFNCQWLDDYHHSIYTALHGTDCDQYTPDYYGVPHIAKSYKSGFVYSGQYCPSRKRRHGRSSSGIDGSKFVVFIQNHDQVGNKPRGTRLAAEVSFEAQKLAAGAYLLSPYIPLIFMGEEYGETAPFYFFTDHSDTELIENIRRGRAEEFSSDEGGDTLPEPQDISTFRKSQIQFGRFDDNKSKVLREFYRQLLKLRRTLSPLSLLTKADIVANVSATDVLITGRASLEAKCLCFYNFSETTQSVPFPEMGRWELVVNSADEKWGGPEKADEPTLQSLDIEKMSVTIQPQSFQLYYSKFASAG